jgi:hypothetical protein
MPESDLGETRELVEEFKARLSVQYRENRHDETNVVGETDVVGETSVVDETNVVDKSLLKRQQGRPQKRV